MNTAEAIQALQKALKEDEGYYQVWQANIAVCIQDVWNKEKPSVDVHKISNEGAKRFLDLLLRE